MVQTRCSTRVEPVHIGGCGQDEYLLPNQVCEMPAYRHSSSSQAGKNLVIYKYEYAKTTMVCQFGISWGCGPFATETIRIVPNPAAVHRGRIFCARHLPGSYEPHCRGMPMADRRMVRIGCGKSPGQRTTTAMAGTDPVHQSEQTGGSFVPPSAAEEDGKKGGQRCDHHHCGEWLAHHIFTTI